ncbi:hypothetical protein E3N88_34693 [Mikania micrantha]|uniref:Pentacotripeptide-repeat region of PRORP domain-containing protein n=1 Tax=Mikania micrantha TaxID=192012 RepID=A0A5N6M1I5_9ASTR|nr:hypothetical protein E3N88_34693 [Mikania micrantha]
MQPGIRTFLCSRKFHISSKPNPEVSYLIFIQQRLVSRFRTCHNQTQNPESVSDDNHEFMRSLVPITDEHSTMNVKALEIQDLLKRTNGQNSVTEIEQALTRLKVTLSEDLVLNVLRRHRSDWKSAYVFFNWVSNSNGYSLGTGSYNEILDILGRMRRFVEVCQLLDEMFKRDKSLINERTYGIVVNRYAAAHKIEEATEFFYKRALFGLDLDLVAFQTLLLSLCRYKHVEAAEFLFHSKMNEFHHNIKSMNIILNGWCVLGCLREAKRFWNDIITSRFKPDRFTYGIFINSLTKAGKISTAGGDCAPNARTYGHLLNSAKKPDEVVKILERMERDGCKMMADTFNLILRLFMGWGDDKRVESTWVEMERNGLGPDQRSYTIMVHGFYDKGRLKEAMMYYKMMVSKGMVAEPRTKLLVDAIKIKLKDRDHKKDQKI